MVPGDKLEVGRYTLELKEVESADNPNYSLRHGPHAGLEGGSGPL